MIRVAYAGVCPIDLEILDGTHRYYKDGSTTYPVVPGHEFSGTVVATGANVDDLKEDDPVVSRCIQGCGNCAECSRDNEIGCAERAEIGVLRRNGAYAQYLAMPSRFVHRLPSDLDLRIACLCEPLAMVVKGLKRLSRAWQPTPPVKRCAVVGVGPIGHLCARVLALQGHQVTVFDRNPARREYFEGSGIQDSNDLEQLAEFEVLVEVTGDPGALDTILHRSPAGATILLLGLPYAHRSFTFEDIVAYDKTVVGSVGSGPADFEQAISLLPQLTLDAFFHHIVPLSRFHEAWASVRESEYLKTVLEIYPA